MEITFVYAGEQPPLSYSKSIFLAGPTPREKGVLDWREEAVELLADLGYDGVVFLPVPRDSNWTKDYDHQVSWELQNLDRADQIVFWVPRSDDLPGFTTNVEYGRYFDSGRAVLGYPKDAPKMRYLSALGREEYVPEAHTLAGTLTFAINNIGAGSLRNGGERDVPLFIWKTESFQSWYRNQVRAGNRLDGAKVLWSFRVGKQKSFTFAFTLHVNVFIASENRNKTNEFVFSRTDVAAVVAYQKPSDKNAYNTKVAMVREFRSPARTSDGCVHECPGGSSFKPGQNPLVVMAHELEEETGLGPSVGFNIDPHRIVRVGSRQLAGTLSSHQAHVFACQLTDEEFAYLEEQQRSGAVHGVEADTERTYVEIFSLKDIMSTETNLVDWSTLGMILTAIVKNGKES